MSGHKTVHECCNQALAMTKPGTPEFSALYQNLLLKHGHLILRKEGEKPGTPGLPCGYGAKR